VLDATPLGEAISRSDRPKGATARGRLAALKSLGDRIVVPEIADYEVRRELLQAGLAASVDRLDEFKAEYDYWPITTAAMLRAAKLWAHLRRSGQPTADPKALDADAILAGQALTTDVEGEAVIVATANFRHLSRFPGLEVRLWDTIDPWTGGE